MDVAGAVDLAGGIVVVAGAVLPAPVLVLGGWALVAGLATPLVLVGAVGTEVRVLGPASPGGCRAVVDESTFLMAGSGSVHVLEPWSPVAWRESRWTADDGYRAVEGGTWALSWTGRDGLLEVDGGVGAPVWPRLHELHGLTG